MVDMKYKIVRCPMETGNTQFSLMLSAKTAENLSLKHEANITLQCGAKAIKVSITITSLPDLTDEMLWISGNALEELLIPENIHIYVQVIEPGNIIKLGPVMGILIDNFLIEDYKKGYSIRESLDCYAEAGYKIGTLVYIFSLKRIDLENKRILGYLPQMNKSMVMSWQEQWLPIPDAIHNRIKISPYSPGYKKINAISNLIPNVKIVNRTTKIYKWTIQKILLKDGEAKKYLPKTLLFKGIDTLTKMLQEFPSIYLKPVGRSLGLGIIKITKEGADEYTAKYSIKGKLYSISGSLTDILPKLKSLMGKRTYIVQEGIPLATYNENIFDLRVSMQKDGTAAWSKSRWKVRVAPPKSIVTNVSAGGTAANVEEIITSVFKEKAPEILNEIIITALIICKAIENKVSGIADIGLDIGVSQQGKIYFIEANFRELRLNGGISEDIESWKSTFTKPVSYLNYLYKTQFQNHKS